MAFENFKNAINEQNNETTMTVDFSKFDQSLDAETLAKLNTIPQKSGFVEIPEGTYNVSLEDLCLRESKAGKLMISVRLKILDGDYANQNWFITFFPVNNEGKVVNMQLAMANHIATQLSCDSINVLFNGRWAEYAKQLAEVLAFSQEKVGHYVIEYTSTMSGSYKNKNYEIMDVFAKA